MHSLSDESTDTIKRVGVSSQQDKPTTPPAPTPPVIQASTSGTPKTGYVHNTPYTPTPYVPKPPCHTGNTVIIKGNPGGLYLGGWSKQAKEEKGWYVIDLTGSSYNSVHSSTDKFNTFMSLYSERVGQRNSLSLPVKDFGIPTYTTLEIMGLAADILKLIQGGNSVLMCCQGGHGRTGMMAAVIAPLLMADTKNIKTNPIDWLRALYCQEVVETSEQVAWVKSTLDEIGFKHFTWDPMPKAAKSFGTSYVYGSAHGGGGYTTHVQKFQNGKWVDDEWDDDYGKYGKGGYGGKGGKSSVQADIENVALTKYGAMRGDYILDANGVLRELIRITANGFYTDDEEFTVWPVFGKVKVAIYRDAPNNPNKLKGPPTTTTANPPSKRGGKKKKAKSTNSGTLTQILPFPGMPDEDAVLSHASDDGPVFDEIIPGELVNGKLLIGLNIWPNYCEACSLETDKLHLVEMLGSVSGLTKFSYEHNLLTATLGQKRTIICENCIAKLDELTRDDEFFCGVCEQVISTQFALPSDLNQVVCPDCAEFIASLHGSDKPAQEPAVDAEVKVLDNAKPTELPDPVLASILTPIQTLASILAPIQSAIDAQTATPIDGAAISDEQEALGGV